MTTAQQRREEILALAAQEAKQFPLLPSGLWFHKDIRDNFYYAIHLYLYEKGLARPDEAAVDLATCILLRVLRLQERDPNSSMYGHWPLNLNPDPDKAKPNHLPVELMGSLLLFVYVRYQAALSRELLDEIYLTLSHVYHSKVYWHEPSEMGHHEAKRFAQQVLMGQLFADQQLLQKGHEHMRVLLNHVKTEGMWEFGSLPWFWHWVQANICVWELAEDEAIRQTAAELLEYLWEQRSLFYLKGAWVGAHARVLPEDVPADRSNLLDYIQFGDFARPDQITRLEGAGLYSYEVPARIRQSATVVELPAVITKLVPVPPSEGGEHRLHHYVYKTADYAAGGMWERALTYLNEQHRWDISLPSQADCTNQAFFFHPGEGFRNEDYRHASPYSEVMLHENTVAALYRLPADVEDRIFGCLPPGEWSFQQCSLFGRVGNVYLAVYLMNDYQYNDRGKVLEVTSSGRVNGVVLEIATAAELAAQQIHDLKQFEQRMMSKAPQFAAENPGMAYISLRGDELKLALGNDEKPIERTINGRQVDFSDYQI